MVELQAPPAPTQRPSKNTPSVRTIRLQELQAALDTHVAEVRAEFERLRTIPMTVSAPCPTCGTDGAVERTVAEWKRFEDRLFTLEDASDALSRRAVKDAENFLGQFAGA